MWGLVLRNRIKHSLLTTSFISALKQGTRVIKKAEHVSDAWIFGAGEPNYSEKAMAPYSSTLAWRIPWMEEPGGLQSMGSLRVGLHDWTTSLSLFTFMHWRRKWQPTPVFLPGESQGQRSLLGCAVYGVAQSWTWLKWLSSSSSSSSSTLSIDLEVLTKDGIGPMVSG